MTKRDNADGQVSQISETIGSSDLRSRKGQSRMKSIDRNNRLSDLAERIRAADTAASVAAREMAERALEAGRLLIEAKAECPHGAWLPFLEMAGVAERQAQRLMMLFRSGLKPDTVSYLGIKGALEFAGKRKLPEPNEVLVVWVGERPSGSEWPEMMRGEITAFVYEDREMPEHLHIAAWRDPTSTIVVTLQGLPRDKPDLVFISLDQVFDERHVEMQFATLRPSDDGIFIAGLLHRAGLEDIASRQ